MRSWLFGKGTTRGRRRALRLLHRHDQRRSVQHPGMLDRESPASQNEESSKAMRPTPTTLCSTAKRISALITLSIQEHFALLNLQKKSAAPGALPPSAFRTASSKLNELRSVPRRRWSVNPSKKSDLHQRSGLGVSIAVATTSLRLQRRVLWLAISSRFLAQANP